MLAAFDLDLEVVGLVFDQLHRGVEVAALWMRRSQRAPKLSPRP